MDVYRISAVTLKIKDMGKSCNFYSKLPGFELVYGGAASPFTTFEVGKGTKMYLNLELAPDSKSNRNNSARTDKEMKEVDFGRIIFHTTDVDALYRFMRNDKGISQTASFEVEPADAGWGERFFHVRDPDDYQLSFAKPISKEVKKYYCE
ncbi:MAG: VOC family protein [Nitrososphaera sp.]|nr:VOC family protein [Nitrososphaera sp.]